MVWENSTVMVMDVEVEEGIWWMVRAVIVVLAKALRAPASSCLG